MAGKAKVRIEGEDSTAAAWKSATARAQKASGQIDGFFKKAFALGGASFVLAKLAGAGREAIEFGDSLNKAAIKAGIGGKAMSELAYAARLADVDISGLSTGIKKLQVALSEAGTGAKAPLLALEALGLKFDDVRRLKPEDQFTLIGDRISKLKDPADRARAATELFGKAGADLLPLFEQGAAGIAKAREEARKLGLSFSDEQLKALGNADDSIKRLDASWQGFWTTLTAKVAPAISDILDKLSGIDTRSVNEKLDDDIDSLEKTLERRNFGLGGGVGGMSGAEEARARAELAGLRARRALADAPNLGERGGRRGRYQGTPVGFAAADAATEAAASAKKAADASEKEWAAFFKDFDEMQHDALEDMNQARNEDFDKFVQNEYDKQQAARELQEELAEYQRTQAMKLSENAQIFKDAFMNAWDDMVNTGKVKWDELLKFIVAEFARRGIANLFDQMFINNGGSQGSGGGFWSSVGNAFASLFGGAKASGGSVNAGQIYAVGERGPELFAPGMNGTIIPNHALGGGGRVVINYNVDARGATMELTKALPGILKQHAASVRDDVIQGIKTRKYDIGYAN